MKAQSISTYGATSALRALVAKNKAEMVKAQQEATTGTVFDVGLSLGSRTGQTVSLRKEYDRLSVLTDMNKLVQQRMTATQTAAGKIIENTQNFLAIWQGPIIPVKRRRPSLNRRARCWIPLPVFNTSFNGEYIFAGVNNDDEAHLRLCGWQHRAKCRAPGPFGIISVSPWMIRRWRISAATR